MLKRDLYYERIPTKSLRDDVRYLGNILGKVIKDQEGKKFFDLVEKTRLLSKANIANRRQKNPFNKLSKEIKKVNPKTLNFETIDKIDAINLNDLTEINPDIRMGPCVGNPSKFLGIGLNFKDHALEQNLPIPDEPIIFSKFTNCVCGPNDDIEIPKGSEHTDWEVELGFVIGKKAKYIPENEALKYVLGFFLVNDVSERNFQKKEVSLGIKERDLILLDQLDLIYLPKMK